MTLSGATIAGQSGVGNDGNEAVLRIPQCFGITGTSPTYCLVSYTGHSFAVSVFYCRLGQHNFMVGSNPILF